MPIPAGTSTSVIPLADVRAFLNLVDSDSGVPDTTHDVELARFLAEAIDVVENIVGKLTPTSYAETYRNARSLSLCLRHYPVVSIEAASASSSTAASYVALTPSTDLEVASDIGVLYRADGNAFSGLVKVTYTAGYSVLPAAIVGGVLEFIRERWQGTQQGYSQTFGAGPTDQISLPTADWRAMLEPYRRAPRVA